MPKRKTSWNKGIHRSEETKRKISEAHRGKTLTEEHKKRISEGGKRRYEDPKEREKTSKAGKGRILSEETKQKISTSLKGRELSEEWKKKISESHKGKKLSEETKQRLSEANKGKKLSEEHKKKISESQKITMNKPEVKRKISEANKGKKLSEEHKRKLSEIAKTRIGEKSPMYGKHHTDETKEKLSKSHKGKKLSEEHKRKLSESRLGEKNHKWNPNREEVYAPYGENFYDQQLRDEKWNLQKGRDMLTGTKLDVNKKPAYHHVDYCKSNDQPDNHCFLSINNHARITNYQRNPIKSERYKKVLQKNTIALKNGQIPKNWSPLNKELFRQEKLKQLDLSSYII